MIVGGTATTGSSRKAQKTYLRMVQNVQLTGSVPKIVRRKSPIIRFSEEDAKRLHHPLDDALVVSIRVGDYNVHQVLVDNGSSVDILYYPAFQQMGIDRAQLILTNAPLVGFGGTRVFPLGKPHLWVLGRRCKTSSSPTRRHTHCQHTCRKLQYALVVGQQRQLGRHPILPNVPTDRD